MNYERKIETAPLTREDAELLVGSVAVNGRMLTVEEIMADPPIVGRITAARDIFTGEMKPTRPGATPMFVFRADTGDLADEPYLDDPDWWRDA